MPATAARPWWRQKRFLIPLGALGLLASAAAVLWWGFLPHYRPELLPDERFGVDVSNHQGDIDWVAVAADGIEFAYIKTTEGGDFVDPWFERNWVGARGAGLDVGAYHYFTLCRPGSEQAQNFLATLPGGEASLPAALDLEFAGNCPERPTREWVHTQVAQFLQSVEDAGGGEVLLYVGGDFDDRYGITEAFEKPLWQRSILRRPEGGRWAIWQFSFFGRVDGIDGGVDLDILRTVHASP